MQGHMPTASYRNAYTETLKLELGKTSVALRRRTVLWLPLSLRMARDASAGAMIPETVWNTLAHVLHVHIARELERQHIGTHRALAEAARRAWGAVLEYDDPLPRDERMGLAELMIHGRSLGAITHTLVMRHAPTGEWDALQRRVVRLMLDGRSVIVNREHADMWRLWRGAH